MLKGMENSVQPRRLKVHRSTFVVATLMTMLSLILIVPGQVVGGGSGGCREYLEDHPDVAAELEGFVSTTLIDHGWPWVFLNRQTLSGGGTTWFGIPWLTPRAWTDWQAECDLEFSPRFLIYDMILLLSISAAVSLAWEWRRRRRNHLLQVRIVDILVATAVISACLGWFVFQRKASAAEQPHVEALWPEYDGLLFVSMDSVIPNFFDRLVGQRDFSITPYRATMLDITPSYDPDASMSIEDAFFHLKHLKALRYIEIGCKPEEMSYRFDLMAQLPHVRTLHLWGDCDENPLEVETAREMVCLQQIKQLVLYDRNAISADALRLLANEMPNCEIIFYEDEPLRWYQ